MGRSTPSGEVTVQWRPQRSPLSTRRSPLARTLPLFGRAAVSLRYRRLSPNILLTSKQERPGEVYRDQPVRRLCRADVGDDGRRLVHHYLVALERRPLRSVALRLAPLAIRVRRLHDRALLDGSRHRALSPPCPMLKPNRSVKWRRKVRPRSGPPSRFCARNPNDTCGSFHC